MAKVTSRVTVRDRGYSRLMRAVKEMERGGLTVGVHPREGRQTYPGGRGLAVADVATIQAAGGPRLPARDPIGAWWRAGGQREVLRATRAALTRSLRSGQPPWAELERAGGRFVAAVRAQFPRQAPLAESTVRSKGSARILVESGRLWAAIGYRVLRRRTRTVE